MNPASSTISFAIKHQLIIGLLLVFFGVSGSWYILSNLHGSFLGFYVGWYAITLYLPDVSLELPTLLAMALVGTLVLSIYSIKRIRGSSIDHREHAAFLVTALSFGYLVLGAWPLWSRSYFWMWQKDIASFGDLLILPLYLGALFAFIAGASSLYVHSQIYHQNHPEIAIEN